jgi:Fur family peroxide stress response transcriptional regulator
MENMDEKIIKALRENNLKVTKTRIEIYKYLVKNHNHPTAEMVYNDIKDRLPGVSFATVYNVLNKLVEIGLAKEFSIGKSKHFDGNTNPHIHFVCMNCGKIEDAELPEYGNLLKVAKDKGWEIKEFSLFIYGICPDCKKKQN